MKVKLSISGETNIGHVRIENEDSFIVAKYDRSGNITEYGEHILSTINCDDASVLIAVADGLGGHAGGAIASQAAIGSISTFVRQQLERGRLNDASHCEILFEAVHACHREVSQLGLSQPGLEEMASTLTAGWISRDVLNVVHVGDSRAYLLRQGDLRQLTTDHTLANKIAQGLSDDADKKLYSRWSNILWNTIGGSKQSPEAEVRVQEIMPGDQILFCTDGLSNSLDEREIQRVMTELSTPTEQCQELVERANEFGGRDNITAIVLHVHERCEDESQSDDQSRAKVSVASSEAGFDSPDQFSAS